MVNLLAFDEKNIGNFILNVMMGSSGDGSIKAGRVDSALRDILVEFEPWDGGEGLLVEEEFDLADIMGDDDDDL